MMHCTAIYFADALSRERALTPEEVNRVTALTIRNGSRRVWTAADDCQLRQLLRKRIEAAKIAEALGRTPWAVRSRVRTLKRKERDCG